MFNRINHVGVVVRDLNETLELFDKLFQLKPAVVKDAMEGKLKVAFVPVGNDEIELLQPLDPEIPLGEALRKSGQGIHHLALSTDNIDADVERLKKKGVLFDQEKPRIGAHGVKIILTRPETTGGITVELCEEKSPNLSS
ncbi:MAG TPA: VOC family protein [Candidatus Bathyarchaeia archaeon]|nr:VOC family protein [Candidatus Bathyarchaeia archaeon]